MIVSTNIKNIVADRRFWILVCYVGAIVTLACFHEPWFDELQAWYLAVVNSPIGLWKAMAVEGHFSLWHFLLFPFAKMGIPATIGLPLVSIPLLSLAAWVLLYKSPFGTWTKVFILLSYPAIYYFPIVSRCYALIPLLLYLTAYLYPRRMRHPIWYGICVGLIANTHVYMEGMYIILMIFWGWEICHRHSQSQSQSQGQSQSQAQSQAHPLCGWLIALLLGLIALAQVLPYFSLPVSERVPFTFVPDFAEVQLQRLYDGYASTIFMTALNHGYGRLFIWARIITVLLIFVGFLWLIRHNRKACVIYIFSFVYQLAFDALIYPMHYHRVYLPFFIMIFCAWISDTSRRYTAIFFGFLLVAGLWKQVNRMRWDITEVGDGFNELRKIQEARSMPMYVDVKLPFLRPSLYCYGPDTLPQAKRCTDLPDIVSSVSHDKPDQFTIFYIDDVQIPRHENIQDMKESLSQMGYEPVRRDSVGVCLKGLNVAVVQYRMKE